MDASPWKRVSSVVRAEPIFGVLGPGGVGIAFVEKVVGRFRKRGSAWVVAIHSGVFHGAAERFGDARIVGMAFGEFEDHTGVVVGLGIDMIEGGAFGFGLLALGFGNEKRRAKRCGGLL